MKDSCQGITKINLSNFRNYTAFTLKCTTAPVALIGCNGVGKTNILEAISLFNPIGNIRNSPINDVINNQAIAKNSNAIVVMQLNDNDIKHKIGLQLSSPLSSKEKKIYKVDGSYIKKQSELTQYLNIMWLTPKMDKIFTDGLSARRKFLDKLVCIFNITHSKRLTNYEYLIRERLHLLKKGNAHKYKSWLDSLETKISELAIAIATTRLQFIDKLKQAQQYALELFPMANCYIDGTCENDVVNYSATEAEINLKKQLEQSRLTDQESARTQYGVHRSEFKVIFVNKDIDVCLCSTGEQKALLISIIMSACRLQKMLDKPSPILLLDEIVAHLDHNRRTSLFQEIINLKVQAWMTSIDYEIFHSFVPQFQIFKVENNSANFIA